MVQRKERCKEQQEKIFYKQIKYLAVQCNRRGKFKAVKLF